MINSVSFHGFLRNNFNKIITKTPKTLSAPASESSDDKFIKNKTLRTTTIAASSLIGAAALVLGGLYVYKKPTKADKTLIKLLEEKFSPFEKAINDTKEEINKFKGEFSQKTNEFIKPILKDCEKLDELPKEVNKNNANQVFRQIEEYKKSATTDSYIKNAAETINNFCETFIQKISENFQKSDQKYKEFTETAYGNLPQSRHSEKIIKSYKEKADFLYKESKLNESACKFTPKSKALDFQGLMTEFKLQEVECINDILEKLTQIQR